MGESLNGLVTMPQKTRDSSLILQEPHIVCAFQAGWFMFDFATVHIYCWKNSGEKYERRVKEIGSVAKAIARRAKKQSSNQILVGDFNIKKSGSDDYLEYISDLV